jgi:hypothetical protein
MPEFDTNLSRAQLAATWFSLCLQVSHDLFDRGYLSLSVPEKFAVDQAVLGHVAALYQTTTPEGLAAQTTQAPMGFQVRPGTQPPSPTASPPPSSRGQDTTTSEEAG